MWKVREGERRKERKRGKEGWVPFCEKEEERKAKEGSASFSKKCVAYRDEKVSRRKDFGVVHVIESGAVHLELAHL